jgi:uncharacterized protein YceK
MKKFILLLSLSFLISGCSLIPKLNNQQNDNKNTNTNTINVNSADSNVNISDDKSLLDTDGDGLTDALELSYGTDIHNPDSDGDGYNDGEEVKNGYNPMGPGKLNDKEITGVFNCVDKNCFEEKFMECKSATFTQKLTDNLIYNYEIMGLGEKNCLVKSSFIVNPNPIWVGKTMDCEYDNSKDFEIAIKDMSNCQGELYNLINYPTTNTNLEVGNNNLSVSIQNCNSQKDCALDEICFEKSCFKISDSFKDYVYRKYSQPPCGQTCGNCTNRGIFGDKTYQAEIGKGDFVLSICKECDKDLACKEGYKCDGYKCVSE